MAALHRIGGLRGMRRVFPCILLNYDDALAFGVATYALSERREVDKGVQAALRHSCLDLTMNVYTDPTLLDVAGALEALPELMLSRVAQADRREGIQ
jgi:hypothetical protein